MLKIGLTGQIGAGKSTVGRILVSRGFPIFDADREMHKLYRESAPLREALGKAFGPSVLLPDGISREKLSQIIFEDPFARSVLENLAYPFLERAIQDFFETIAPDSKTLSECYPQKKILSEIPFPKKKSIAFLEAALLHKIPRTVSSLDEIWIIEADKALRMERLLLRGLSESDAKVRMKIQENMPLPAHGTFFKIDNSGSEKSLEEKVKRALSRFF